MAPKRGPRLVLVAGVLFGVVNAVVFPATNPEQVALASDLYYESARVALRGGDVYAGPGFLYPPPVVVAFYPHALLGDPALAFALQTAINLACLGALATIAVRLVERGGIALEQTDRVLVAAFVLVSPLSVVNLVNGQVNPWLALAVGAGALLLERTRSQDASDAASADRDGAPSDRDADPSDRAESAAGVAFGLAALVKLFPALVGAWLLRLRAWRAIAAATATGLGLLLVGLLAFGPGTFETYVSRTLTGEMAVASFPDGPDHTEPYVTVRRQLALVAPGLSGTALLAASLLVVSPVVAAANRTVATLCTRLVALQATLFATLLAFPLESFYLLLAFCPLVPLLYLLDRGMPRRLFLAGSVLVAVPATYEDVLVLTGASVVPPDVAAAVQGVARGAFSVVLPPTVGVWLVLAGCLLYQHRAVAEST